MTTKYVIRSTNLPEKINDKIQEIADDNMTSWNAISRIAIIKGLESHYGINLEDLNDD